MTRVTEWAAWLTVLAIGGCATSPEHVGSVVRLPHPMEAVHGIDQLYVADTFRPKMYDLLVVKEPVVAAPLSDPELRATPWAKTLQAALAHAMRSAGLFAGVAEQAGGELPSGNILVLESAIVDVDPGNQMARLFFAEMGGGHSFVEIEGRIFDPHNQEVLVQFSDRRRGAGVLDITGGESEGLLRDDVRGIARGFGEALRVAVTHQ